jgi:outer membrane protein assembly factor BamB
MKNNDKLPETSLKLWKGIALFAGIFSFVICFLIIANFVQINRIDPVNVETVNALVQRLHENPEDLALREQIRELDLLARKAYFTTQWQIRTGGYLLVAGIALLILSLQMIISARPKNPVPSALVPENYLFTQKNARKWITAGGISLVAVALLLAFLTHNKLRSNLSDVSNSNQITENQEAVEIPIAEISDSTNVAQTGNEVSVLENQKMTTAQDSSQNTVKTQAPEDIPAEKPVSISKVDGFPSDDEFRQNFPFFRGFNGLGIAYQIDIPTDWDGAEGRNILWKIKIPLPGFNSPIVWGDRVFLTGASNNKKEVYCIEASSGKILWTAEVKDIPGSPETPPKVTPDTGHAAPGMATDGQRVYAIFSNGDIIALDFAGNRVWAKNLGVPKNHYGHSSSLITFKNKLIVQYDQGAGGQVMALSVSTGEILWNTPRKVKISWASPILISKAGRTEIVLVADPNVAGYDPETGAELWSIKGVIGEVGPSAGFADGVVFVTNEYSKLMAIKVGEKPEVLWESDEFLSDVPSPVATKDLLFLVTSYGAVACYDAKTGDIFWEHEFDQGFYSSPMLVENRVYLINKQGVTHIFKADKTFELIAEPKLGEKSVCTPAFSNGRIFLRTETSLFCIGS